MDGGPSPMHGLIGVTSPMVFPPLKAETSRSFVFSLEDLSLYVKIVFKRESQATALRKSGFPRVTLLGREARCKHSGHTCVFLRLICLLFTGIRPS